MAGAVQLVGMPTGSPFFEDIIDGYFPLQTSLGDMMRRRGLKRALLSLSHAPIVHIPGLPLSAPVPVTIRGADAGVIKQAVLFVEVLGQETVIRGYGDWRWLTGSNQHRNLDVVTRLAEPAFLSGLGLADGAGAAVTAVVEVIGDDHRWDGNVLQDLGWNSAYAFGPFSETKSITWRAGSFGDRPTNESQNAMAKGTYVFVRAAPASIHRAFPNVVCSASPQ